MKRILVSVIVAAFAVLVGCSESEDKKLLPFTGSDTLLQQFSGGTGTGVRCINQGGSYGDPHFCTMDGRYFSNQYIGEFVLAREPGGKGLEVHVRQQRVNRFRPSVTLNSLVAMRIDDSIIQFKASSEAVLIDKEIVFLQSGKVHKLKNGGEIFRRDTFSYYVRDAAKKKLVWLRGWTFYSVYVAFDGALEGILGDNDGDNRNDLRMRNGELTKNIGDFMDSWRLTDEESIITYEPGESTATYTAEQDAKLDISAEALDAARKVCLARFSEEACDDATVLALAIDLAGGVEEKEVLDSMDDIKEYIKKIETFTGDSGYDFPLGLLPPYSGSDNDPAGVPKGDLEPVPGDNYGGSGVVIAITGDSKSDGVDEDEDGKGKGKDKDGDDSGDTGDEPSAAVKCLATSTSLVRHGRDVCIVEGKWYSDASTIFTYQAGKALAGFKFNGLDSGVYEVTVKARLWGRGEAGLPAEFTDYKVALFADGINGEAVVPASSKGWKKGVARLDLTGGDTDLFVNWYNGLCSGDECVNFQLHSIKLKRVGDSQRSALTSSIFNIYKKNTVLVRSVVVIFGVLFAALIGLFAFNAMRKQKEM